MVTWIKMSEFGTKAEALAYAATLRRFGWRTKITKHKLRVFNQLPSRYTVYRSYEKKKRRT